MTNNYNNFTVIIDTREQQPWSFKEYTTANHKLDTGDYSIQGLENIICIERKKSISEFANNIVESRFKDVVMRMSQLKYAFLLLEFDLADMLNYPIGSTVPKKMWDKIKINPAFLVKNIIDLQLQHNVQVYFCGNAANAEKLAAYIFKKIHYLETIKNKSQEE